MFQSPAQLRRLFSALALMTFMTLASLASARAATASDPGGPFGIGIMLGEPSSITGKYILNDRRAIDAGLSFNFDRWTVLYGDYLFSMPGAFRGKSPVLNEFTPYLGVGGLLIFSNKSDAELRNEKYYSNSSSSRMALGIRLPIGIEWRPPTVPVGIFVEIVPGLTIVPATYGFVQGGVGVRYFF